MGHTNNSTLIYLGGLGEGGLAEVLLEMESSRRYSLRQWWRGVQNNVYSLLHFYDNESNGIYLYLLVLA